MSVIRLITTLKLFVNSTAISNSFLIYTVIIILKIPHYQSVQSTFLINNATNNTVEFLSFKIPVTNNLNIFRDVFNFFVIFNYNFSKTYLIYSPH